MFKRDASNILVDAKVPLSTALLGGKVRVPTVDGQVELTISPGTQPGERQVMRKKGVVKLKGTERGDQIITIKVEMPKKLTDKQKSLLMEAFEVTDGNADDTTAAAPKCEKGKGFFDGIFSK